MTQSSSYQALVEQQRRIQQGLQEQFAPEDDALRTILSSMKEAGLPEIQISPLQGKLLQFLAATCNARKILEIGSLGGYSGTWLARALPAGGRLITLEINPVHAQVVRASFARAGVGDRTEVRTGRALDLLPQLQDEAPFDLVFIDADKSPYPHYLEWAVRLARPGSIIVADNCVRRAFQGAQPTDPDAAGVIEYNRRIAQDPRLVSLALAMDDDYIDGFAISVVKPA